MEWQPVLPSEYVEEVKRGDLVEVQVSPGAWVSGRVIADMETRISVVLDNPILVITRTQTITHRIFSWNPCVTEDETSVLVNTWTAGRAYVRYPKDRPV